MATFVGWLDFFICSLLLPIFNCLSHSACVIALSTQLVTADASSSDNILQDETTFSEQRTRTSTELDLLMKWLGQTPTTSVAYPIQQNV